MFLRSNKVKYYSSTKPGPSAHRAVIITRHIVPQSVVSQSFTLSYYRGQVSAMMCWQQEKAIEKELMCLRSILAPDRCMGNIESSNVRKNQSLMWRQLN